MLWWIELDFFAMLQYIEVISYNTELAHLSKFGEACGSCWCFQELVAKIYYLTPTGKNYTCVKLYKV